MKTFIAIAVAIGLAPISPVAHAQSLSEKAAKDELVFMRDEDPVMRRAFEVAKSTLDEFLRTASAPSQNQTAFSLKVAISQGKNTEYFWVNDFVSKGTDKFEGEIGNEPRMVKTVKLGQRYVFSRAQIVDWLYLDKEQRRMVGNFTLCALLTKESKEEAEATKRRYKLDCSQVVK